MGAETPAASLRRETKTMKKTISRSEYVKLLRIANTELRGELKKPDASQDRELIAQCLESIAYYEGELLELKREKASRGGVLRALGRFGAALAALVVCFALFATVSEAMGFRVWTAIIKRDAGYLRVDYVPEPSASPIVFDGWSDGEYSFFSDDEFAEKLKSDGFEPFAAEGEGYGFVEGSVRSTKTDYYASYTLQKGSCFVRIRMIAKANKPTPVTVWGVDESIPYDSMKVSGAEVLYQMQNDGCIFATWQARGCIFCASLFDLEDPPETVLGIIVK